MIKHLDLEDIKVVYLLKLIQVNIYRPLIKHQIIIFKLYQVLTLSHIHEVINLNQICKVKDFLMI